MAAAQSHTLRPVLVIYGTRPREIAKRVRYVIAKKVQRGGGTRAWWVFPLSSLAEQQRAGWRAGCRPSILAELAV